MKKDEREIRAYGDLNYNEESRTITGYALKFNTLSNKLTLPNGMGYFYEEIEPRSLDGVIEKSNVLALLNHEEQRGVLATCKKGKGSMTLEVDEIGLRFQFDAPHTQLGDETLEMIKRGDITGASFAFKVKDDVWEKRSDETCLRTIKQIDRLYDISPVYLPAYDATEVAIAQRSLDAFNEITTAEEERQEETQPIENEEVRSEEEEKEQPKEEKEEEEKEEEKPSDEEKEEKPSDDEEKEEKPKEEERKSDTNTKHNIMETKTFSLLKTIRSIVNNQPIDEVNQAILDMGQEEMRKSGCAYSGQIQLPIEERGAAQATVQYAGQEIVETEKLNILEPLRNRMVLNELGATFMTGLVGNISIPTYSGTNCTWEDEVDAAKDGLGTFGTVDYSPKRITAYIDVSKQFINQDAVGAEALLRQDIVNAVADKLEATILGSAAGSSKQPKGIFYQAGEPTLTFAGLVDMEETLEEHNITGEYKFVVNPSIKATLKTTTVGGTKSDLRMLLENGEANGYKVLSTGNCAGIALANWSDLLVCQFGALDLTVDPYSQATKGCVRIVVNAYFDAGFRRADSVVAKMIAADSDSESEGSN